MIMMRRALSIIMAMAMCLGAGAADGSASGSSEVVRPVMSAYMLRMGSSHLTDTYLTPLKYSGWSMGFGYERMQAMKFDPVRWVMQMRAGIDVDRTHNPSGNAVMWYWGADFSWSMMRRWRMTEGLTVGGGGMASADLGCIYAPRNGNNPASAKASVTVGVTGYAAWTGKVGLVSMTLRYQPSIPVLGAFFAPDYGELYYEIYLGNYSGLAHCAWWKNYFNMKNLLTADIHFGATSLRLGYLGNILSTKVNDVTSNLFTHSFIIGVSGEWLSINRRHGLSNDARIISAIY